MNLDVHFQNIVHNITGNVVSLHQQSILYDCYVSVQSVYVILESEI